MITAKNYAAQAEAAIGNFINSASGHSEFEEDVNNCISLQNDIRNAVHFAMPDGGKFFDKNVNGIRDQALRLPYPLITVEYNFLEGLNVSKSLIIAKEIKNDVDTVLLKSCGYMSSGAIADSEYIILIRNAFYIQSKKVWTLSPLVMVMPNQWDNMTGIDVSVSPPHSKPFIGMVGGTYKILPQFFQQLANEIGEEEAHSRLKDELACEAVSLLEFLEALSCKNVEQSTHQKASPKNAQRIKSHKLPIYETKVLTLKPTVSQVSRAQSLGTHASPRQHLRRGHIRRLENGNIWVNACVVGDATKGVINKQYKMAI